MGRGRPGPQRHNRAVLPVVRRAGSVIAMTAGRPVGAYPPPGRGTIPMLSPVSAKDLPPGPVVAPRNPHAEVVQSDRSWQRVTVVAWRPHERGWLALTEWPNGVQDWRVRDARNLRPR